MFAGDLALSFVRTRGQFLRVALEQYRDLFIEASANEVTEGLSLARLEPLERTAPFSDKVSSVCRN